MAYTDNGILLALQKGKIPGHTVDKPWGHFAKQSQEEKYCMIPFIQAAYSSQIYKQKVEQWFPGD